MTPKARLQLLSPVGAPTIVAMSVRKLGGGRVLGSGKGLAPPPPSHAPRPSSPFAPSDVSSLSVGSQNLSGISPPTPPSPLPGLPQDLAANISLGATSQAGASGTKLLCPICDEEMVSPPDLSSFCRGPAPRWSVRANPSKMTLLQLNRYPNLYENGRCEY